MCMTCGVYLVGHQIRSNRAFSYPKVNYPPPSTYHIQAISDVRSKLDYTDASCVPITEESSVQVKQSI